MGRQMFFTIQGKQPHIYELSNLQKYWMYKLRHIDLGNHLQISLRCI